MRLQSINIKGFKSFADELKLSLQHPITGIIGPNGCGKSNLVDALRWVLGEHRPLWLRSEQMKDLIFNGTKHRKALHMAEVSLTLDNTQHALSTDYAQVTLTRRMYRNGENEYSLNGVRSRRKDLTGLLLDSGLHAEAYSIIELKMIDRLLHNTDDTRRLLFEQAAGISSFKTRKKETLARLSDTQQHMSRLEDLLHEIQDNLQGLEKQARHAKKYSEVKDAYKNLRCFLNERHAQALQTQQERLQEQLDSEQKRQHTQAHAYTQQSAQLEKQKLAVLEKEKQCQTIQKALHSQESRIQQAEHALQLDEERLRTLTQQRRTFKDTHRLYLEKKAESQAQIQSIEAQKTDELAKKEVLSKRLNTSRQAQEEASQAFEACHNQRNTQEETLQKARERYHHAQNKEVLAKDRMAWLDTQTRSQDKEHAEQKKERHSTHARCEQLAQAIQRKKITLDNRTRDAQKARYANKEHEQQRQYLEDAYRATSHTLNLARKEQQFLRAIHAEREGASDAIRFLQKTRAWEVKDAPLVMELVSCPAPYRAAVESYLEPYAQHYVVDTESQAQEAMSLLQKAQKGRASFFVLDRLQDKDIPAAPPNAPGEPLWPLLQVPPPYEKLMRCLFSHVYITEAPVGKHRRFTWVRKDGFCVYKPYTLSGGSPPQEESSHMTRKERLESLEKYVYAIEKNFLKQEKGIEKQKARIQQHATNILSKQEAEKAQTLQELQALEQEANTTASQHAQAEKLLRATAEKKAILQSDTHTAQQELQQSEVRSKKATTQLLSERKAFKASDKTATRLRKDLEQQQRLVSHQRVQVHKQQNTIERLDALLAFQTRQQEDYLKTLQAQDHSHEDLEKSILALEKKIPEKKTQNAQHYKEKTRLEQSLHAEEEAYYSARGHTEALEKTRTALTGQQENSKVLLAELEGKQQHLSLARTHLQERQRMSLGEDATCTHKDKAWDTMDEEALEEKANQLEGRLSRMGEVNMLAIKNYEALQERYAFICKEKEDVLSAQQSLEATIHKIEETVQRQFTDAFEKTKQHFKDLFGMVFGSESACDIRLSDEKDPLEARIAIVAKPKGKHLRSIEQLSSGERTLTALCLLFAVYAYKPSPFCVLDEVDAPLDDANIEKFNHLIKTLSAKAQFLLITHNKLTMQHTEAIYGVTMVDGGVSRVLAVDWSAGAK